MRPILCLAATVLLTTPVSAKIYKCTSASGETAYQQTPCKGVSEIVETAPAPASVSGFNKDCTAFNGHKVLGLGEIDRLDDAEQEAYLQWMFSDEAPDKAEKESCLEKKERRKEAASKETGKNFSKTAALESYTFTRVVQRQISACRGIAPIVAEDAQSALDEYKESTNDLRQQGESLAKSGTSVNGERLEPDEIEAGIREKEQSVLSYFGKITPENENEMIEKCENTIAMIDLKYAQLP